MHISGLQTSCCLHGTKREVAIPLLVCKTLSLHVSSTSPAEMSCVLHALDTMTGGTASLLATAHIDVSSWMGSTTWAPDHRLWLTPPHGTSRAKCKWPKQKAKCIVHWTGWLQVQVSLKSVHCVVWGSLHFFEQYSCRACTERNFTILIAYVF